jgi:hypothetical protein
MAAPSFIQEAETAWNTDADSTASVATASFNVVAGDILVAYGIVANNLLGLTISGGSLTWDNKQTVNVTDYCWLGLWTATVDSDKSMAVTFARTTDPGAQVFYGGNVLTFRASDGVGASNKTNVASGAPTLNLGTTQDNSVVVVANGDWNAADGASRTWRANAGALTEKTYFRDSSNYTVYGGYHADAGAANTYAVGLSAPTGQKYSIAAVEIKGTAAAGQPAAKRLGGVAFAHGGYQPGSGMMRW